MFYRLLTMNKVVYSIQSKWTNSVKIIGNANN